MDQNNIRLNVLTSLILKYTADARYEAQIAELAADLIWRFAWPPLYTKYFEFWEARGFHLIPVNYYQPIPDSRQLGERTCGSGNR